MPSCCAPIASVSPPASSVRTSAGSSTRNCTPCARACLAVSSTCAPATVKVSAPSAAPVTKSRRAISAMGLPPMGLLFCLIEVAQIGRRLALLERHQIAVGAQIIAVLADLHMLVADRADVVDPDRRLLQTIGLVNRPRAGQGMVERGHLVVHDAGIRRVAPDAFLEHGLIVGMQRNAGIVEGTRTREVAGLDLEHAVAAVGPGLAPGADRVAGE